MTCLYICLSVIHVFAQTREHGRTGEFNILDFGATRDTMMVHTKAINEAIESCYRQGGEEWLFLRVNLRQVLFSER